MIKEKAGIRGEEKGLICQGFEGEMSEEKERFRNRFYFTRQHLNSRITLM